MHESGAHGVAITRRKSSEDVRTQKLKLGKEERRGGSNGDKSRNVSECLDTHLCMLELTFVPA